MALLPGFSPLALFSCLVLVSLLLFGCVGGRSLWLARAARLLFPGSVSAALASRCSLGCQSCFLRGWWLFPLALGGLLLQCSRFVRCRCWRLLGCSCSRVSQCQGFGPGRRFGFSFSASFPLGLAQAWPQQFVCPVSRRRPVRWPVVSFVCRVAWLRFRSFSVAVSGVFGCRSVSCRQAGGRCSGQPVGRLALGSFSGRGVPRLFLWRAWTKKTPGAHERRRLITKKPVMKTIYEISRGIGLTIVIVKTGFSGCIVSGAFALRTAEGLSTANAVAIKASTTIAVLEGLARSRPVSQR